MKTPSTLKTTIALFSAALLLSVSGRADQNFTKTINFSTLNYSTSDFGVSAVLGAHDDFTVPTATTAGNYSVTTTGTVTGKILRQAFTAVSGTGTAKVMPDGSATFSGSITVAQQAIINLPSSNISSYTSPHFIGEAWATKSIPFHLVGIPFFVSTKVTASIDACIHADAVFTPTFVGVPKVALSIGPEADLGASAEASVGVGINGLASLSAGTVGTLTLGKVALKANPVVIPTQRFVALENGRIMRKLGADVQASIVASTLGLNGKLDIFAQTELPFIGVNRATQNIASFTSSPVSTTLLTTQTYRWF